MIQEGPGQQSSDDRCRTRKYTEEHQHDAGDEQQPGLSRVVVRAIPRPLAVIVSTLRVMRSLVTLVAASLVVAACGSSAGTDQSEPARTSTSSSAPASGPTSAPTSAPEAPAVPAALDFTLPGVTGPSVRGADYAGKSLALWFWAPW